MAQFIFLLIFAACLNSILTDPSSKIYKSEAFASSSASAIASSSGTSSANCTSTERKCGKNQIYDLCPTSCPPRTCATKDIYFSCVTPPMPGDPKCLPPKCRCADNYYSNAKGQCVSKEQCPTKTCGSNEIYDPCPVPSCAAQTCENIGKKFSCPAIPADYPCKGECRCKPGYYRNQIGQCISKSECNQCGKNQIFDLCPPTCPPMTCKTKDAEFKCIPPPKPGDPECPAPKCRCAPGYYSNDQGECVLKEDCPKCGKNQVYDLCPASCPPRTCATKDVEFDCIAPLKIGDPDCPAPKCRCADNYYSNNEGECVLKEECPAKDCGSNEIYVSCPKPTCTNQTCDNIGKIYHCPLLPSQYPCKGECRCKPGYYRNKIGRCISEQDCKKCTGDYEYFDCDNACDNICSELSTQSHANCPILNIQCNQMCYCIEGYARDADGKCIPISQCPPLQCGPNQVASDCANSPCLKNCATKDLNLQCKPYPPGCKPGCVCAAGYLKDDNDVCVPINECPSTNPPQCGPNEVSSDCGNNGCLPTCAEPERLTYCSYDPAICKPGCVCQDGYLRDDKGVCVPKDECLPNNEVCPNPNEYLDKCSTNCPDNQCGIGVIPTFVACTRPSNPADCIARCRCKEGYYRTSNDDDECVTLENCPPQCGPNEVPSDCGNNGCLPTCAEPERLTYCDYDPASCKPGCVCEEGHLRDDKGVCVPKDECLPKENVCLLPPETGPCRASMPKFYYDSCKKDCLQFIYGGCGGNGNKFDTKAECLQRCSCTTK